MGGVDLADMLVALYRTPFRSKRWYMAMFAQIIDICVDNAWILYRKHANPATKCMQLKDFCYEVYHSLISTNKRVTYKKTDESTTRRLCKTRPADSSRYDGVSHFPSVKEEGRCMNCNKKTTVYCLKY
ncbi:hypothetical protein PYW07_006647 [Mythimna separata]|uniref:PiggyBac transposable element-derived protein domain-containing protein n=1 Tax=Mythimna separata TaxID=271217 RepID=A0AAD7YU18_MYTSE|nr:hypothetical protein PYW07_006647 [Mythimna separata]